MKVRGQDMRVVWWSDDGIHYIDQRALPMRVEIGVARDVEEVARAIEVMAVRGAPLIGVFAAYGFALAARRGAALDAAYARLSGTRPTALNLWSGLDAVRAAAPNPCVMLAAARAYDDAGIAAAEAIGTHGLTLFRHGTRVLTHCNAGWLAVQDWGTALAPVYKAARAGLEPFVYVSETRPRLQGARLTAWELREEGVAHVVIADSAAAHLIQRGQVDLVLTGADRVAANGDAANKIGTYSRALAASAHGVPFYVAAPLSTIDRAITTGAEIPIEERPEDEVLTVEGVDDSGALVRVRVTPAGTKALNPAFDVTPHRLITGIVTEVGIVPASDRGIAEAFRRAADATRPGGRGGATRG
ncbi:MAG: S-methyl-5-thioribose-1-phosphate isomerase [Candidatus Eisenbacteria bacterium]|nr:S-methyl-5-thioribose-1-phosphate isomerase [Candidatus Eisenbacteria bacterium]